MKILVMTLKERVERFFDLGTLPPHYELVYSDYEKDVDKLLAIGKDAFAIFADAVEPVPAALINGMPNLRIVHSEGVGYEGIDLDACDKRQIYVCNNRGVNGKAVAEQALLLMLGVLRRVAEGDRMVRAARQIEAKAGWSLQGIPELGSKKVGLIGMGSIARETASLLRAFGCAVSYHSTHRHEDAEDFLSVTWEDLNTLLSTSDIVSLHIPVNPETFHYMDKEKFDKMKPGAILINTSRGDIVDQRALVDALKSGRLHAAGLDTISPEPVQKDNELLSLLTDDIRDRILFSPHIGGVTEQAFERMHRTVWQNIRAVERGERPVNIVNHI